MRRITVVFIVLLFSPIWFNVAEAHIARGGGGARPSVGNRSAGAVSHGNFNRADVNRGAAGGVNRGAVGGVNRGAVGGVDRGAVGGVNREFAGGSRSVAGVNRNFAAANVNRNVDVHGWGAGSWADDPHWGWGSFAGGAAAAATGAAIGAAAAAPSAGGVVTALPPTCTPVQTGGGALYNCGGSYYQPAYQGADLVYQSVQHP